MQSRACSSLSDAAAAAGRAGPLSTFGGIHCGRSALGFRFPLPLQTTRSAPVRQGPSGSVNSRRRDGQVSRVGHRQPLSTAQQPHLLSSSSLGGGICPRPVTLSQRVGAMMSQQEEIELLKAQVAELTALMQSMQQQQQAGGSPNPPLTGSSGSISTTTSSSSSLADAQVDVASTSGRTESSFGNPWVVSSPFHAQTAAYSDRRLQGQYDARFHSTGR
jgi:hypothetical protein